MNAIILALMLGQPSLPVEPAVRPDLAAAAELALINIQRGRDNKPAPQPAPNPAPAKPAAACPCGETCGCTAALNCGGAACPANAAQAAPAMVKQTVMQEVIVQNGRRSYRTMQPVEVWVPASSASATATASGNCANGRCR